MAEFMKHLLAMPFPWNIWVMSLGGLNMIGSLIFWQHTPAKLAMLGLVVSMLVMLWLFKKYGFVRLLALGHIIGWVPLIIAIVLALSKDGIHSPVSFWYISLLFFNGISLVIDFADVVRYFAGEREPQVEI